MPIIDAHVHLYPPELNANPAGWAAARGEAHWAKLCARKRKNGRPVQAFPSVDELLRALDAAGVERAVLLGWYWEKHDACAWQNRFYARCVRAHPDRFSAFAAVQPAAGDAALAEIRRARDDGLVGLGELSPHSQGIDFGDPRWLAVVALADELRLPVNLHVTDPSPATGNYPGRVETPLEDFAGLAERFPNVNFILAHWGGAWWRHGARFFSGKQNVYFDTAASPLLYDSASTFTEGLAACGADRVLWGTDFPLDLYPRGSPGGGKVDALGGFLAEARGVLPADVAGAVLGGNAARLLRLASRG